MRIKEISVYNLFPQSIMLGLSYVGDGLEIFLGLFAISIRW